MTTGHQRYKLGVPDPHRTHTPCSPAVNYSRHTPVLEDHPHEESRILLERDVGTQGL